tara:strand:+ start:7980 stop:8297 length:318 start_codon:yes stop_codon:yes gene_type:complete
MKDIGDLCTSCHEDTSFGTGLYVNRIPSGTETEEGWLCPTCQMHECDRCEKNIEVDCDITITIKKEWQEKVHYDCMSNMEQHLYNKKQNEDYDGWESALLLGSDF